eukprot:SAG31_NODE_3332_length_4395_cov_3.833799_2_plen_147_part_00
MARVDSPGVSVRSNSRGAPSAHNSNKANDDDDDNEEEEEMRKLFAAESRGLVAAHGVQESSNVAVAASMANRGTRSDVECTKHQINNMEVGGQVAVAAHGNGGPDVSSGCTSTSKPSFSSPAGDKRGADDKRSAAYRRRQRRRAGF